MNTGFLRKYVWLLLALLLPCGFSACSDSDEPTREPEVIKPSGDDKQEQTTYYTLAEAYINQFCYDHLSTS